MAFIRTLFWTVALVGLLIGLYKPLFGGFAIGPMLDPWNGLYRTARMADDPLPLRLYIDSLTEPVSIVTDHRGVPHIYAQNDDDLLVAFGYVVARDRLFEMDFIPRAASGRLSEVLGPSALNTDRFFRSIGLAWAADKNRAWLESSDSEQIRIARKFQDGANAYVASLEPRDYPFEMRLLGYAPQPFDIENMQQLLLYMTYDLSYRGQGSSQRELRRALGDAEYERLYPHYSRLYEPIIPPPDARWKNRINGYSDARTDDLSNGGMRTTRDMDHDELTGIEFPTGVPGTVSEGYQPGIGSNNWAVSAKRSSTGFPILAGDMHLNLSLPALWYEAHLVSPNMNVYGVTIPGAPAIVEGITPTTAWAYTNTGSDQIDYYALDMDSTGSGYWIDGIFEPFTAISDTITVAGADPVIEELLYSRYGPVLIDGSTASSIRWVAHDSSRTAVALWRMGLARSYTEFEAAIENWDSPMQNILFASREDTLAIRSTGYLPIRSGTVGQSVIDGSRGENYWSGRVPFEELPYAVNPGQGYLASANQQPADSTYPHYLGSDWRDGYRSIRINSLLRAGERHSVEDFMGYQSDVHAVQADQFLPFLEDLTGLSEGAEAVRSRLMKWNRDMDVESVEPVLFDYFLTTFVRSVWDEAVFLDRPNPAEMTILHLLTTDSGSHWFDLESTTRVEDASDLLRMAIEETGKVYTSSGALNDSDLRWGNQNQIVFKHISRSEALKPLWRGPYSYPGYRATLSPSASRMNTFSASWRVIVDFSSVPPRAFGIYPGGQSGNPFSGLYDAQVETYLSFGYNPLIMAPSPETFPLVERWSTTLMRPGDIKK